MLDTNIFDKLITDPYFPDIWQALDQGLLEFITTPIQEGEINSIADLRKKRLMLCIPRKVVPAAGNPDLTPDQQIVATAARAAELFVTEDKSLSQWYQLHFPRHPICDFHEFRAWLLQILGI